MTIKAGSPANSDSRNQLQEVIAMSSHMLFTLLHLHSHEQIRHFLRNLRANQRELFTTQNSLGDTAAHIAVYKKNNKALRGIIACLDEQERVDMLSVRNSIGNTVLDEAITISSVSLCRDILDSLQTDQTRLQILLMKNQRGWTALHRAAVSNQKDICKILLESVRSNLRQSLTLAKDSIGWTILRTAASLPDHNIFMCILEACNRADRVAILRAIDSDGDTILHHIVAKGHIDTLEKIIEKIDDSWSRKHLFQSVDAEQRTLLHIAAESSNSELVKRMMALLGTEDKFSICYNGVDSRGQTPVHYAARNLTSRGNSITKCLLHSISEKERFAILVLPDGNHGNLALHEAVRVNSHAVRTIVRSVDSAALLKLLEVKNNHGLTARHASHRPNYLATDRGTIDSSRSDLNKPIQAAGGTGEEYTDISKVAEGEITDISDVYSTDTQSTKRLSNQILPSEHVEDELKECESRIPTLPQRVETTASTETLLTNPQQNNVTESAILTYAREPPDSLPGIGPLTLHLTAACSRGERSQHTIPYSNQSHSEIGPCPLTLTDMQTNTDNQHEQLVQSNIEQERFKTLKGPGDTN